MSARIQRAILSVTDKTGLVDFARKLSSSRRRTHLHRRHRQTPARLRHRSERHLRPHRLPRNARRPRQDAASQSSRRHPASPRRSRARRGRRRARHSAHRHGRRESLRLREDCGQARSALRRTDREHRHRRPVDDPLRRQEFSGRRHRHFARRLRLHRRRTVTLRRRALARNQVAPRAKGLRHHRCLRFRHRLHARTHQRRRIFTCNRRNRISRPPCASPSTKRLDLRYGENPHQKAAMYSDGSGSRRRQRAPTAGQRTFLQQHRRPAGRMGSRPGIRRTRRAPSSSTPTPAAPLPARLSPKPTSAPSNAIRFQPSAA